MAGSSSRPSVSHSMSGALGYQGISPSESKRVNSGSPKSTNKVQLKRLYYKLAISCLKSRHVSPNTSGLSIINARGIL